MRSVQKVTGVCVRVCVCVLACMHVCVRGSFVVRCEDLIAGVGCLSHVFVQWI